MSVRASIYVDEDAAAIAMVRGGIKIEVDGTRVNRYQTEDQIDYDEHFTEQVANGDPNPLVDLTIRVGEYDLTEESGDTYFLDDYLYFHLRKLLDAVEDIVRGEQRNLHEKTHNLARLISPYVPALRPAHFRLVCGRPRRHERGRRLR